VNLSSNPFCEALGPFWETAGSALKEQYVRAVNAFGKALSEVKSHRCENQIAARQLTQSTSQACQYALKAFMDHV